jgi:D-hydroxyproline dehydrogenase subunit alpha
MSARFDVIVVGAGPGGIAAATVSAEAGKRVCLLDANPSPGGQIWRGLRRESAHNDPHGAEFTAWKLRLENSGCEVWSSSQAVDLTRQNCLRIESEAESRDVEFDRLILATGARERFLPFPGWTLPGVMGVGGAQALVKSGLDPRGKRVIVAGSGPLLLAVAANLARAGAKIEGIFEQAPLSRLASFGFRMMLTQPGKLMEGARYRLQTLGAAYHCGSWVKQAEGHGRLERVQITTGGRDRTIACDWLACGFHLVPNLELPRLLGCRIEAGYVAVDALQQSSVPGVACIGELTGIGGLGKALIEGQIAGLTATGRESKARAFEPQRRRQQEFASNLDRAFAPRAELRALPADQTIVCRCEDVTHGTVAACSSWRQAKLHTRCGMGACQGRICGAATEFLYGWNSTDSRPPVFPVRVSTLVAERDTVRR